MHHRKVFILGARLWAGVNVVIPSPQCGNTITNSCAGKDARDSKQMPAKPGEWDIEQQNSYQAQYQRAFRSVLGVKCRIQYNDNSVEPQSQRHDPKIDSGDLNNLRVCGENLCEPPCAPDKNYKNPELELENEFDTKHQRFMSSF